MPDYGSCQGRFDLLKGLWSRFSGIVMANSSWRIKKTINSEYCCAQFQVEIPAKRPHMKQEGSSIKKSAYVKKSLTLRGSILPFDLSESYFSDGIKKMENRWNKCSKHNITLYKKTVKTNCFHSQGGYFTLHQ